MRPSPLIALCGVFCMNGLAISLWLPRIPDVKAALGLDLWTMSLCLLGMPVGTMAGFFFAARLTRAIGRRVTSMVFGAAVPLSLILPAFATGPVTLTVTLLLFGLLTAQVEVGINAKANEMQRNLGRRIMSRCHGLWSVGMMSGGLIAGTFTQNSIGFATQQIVAEPLVALAAALFALALPADDARLPEPKRKGFALPGAALLVLCIVPIGALLVEGSMFDWSVLFLREEVGVEPFAASAVFAIFAMTMGFGRLTGDHAAELLGVTRLMLLSGLCMGVGVAAFALAPSLMVAAPAAALAGYGAANVYPLAMSLAPDVPGPSPEQNVAVIALTGFSAFLIGPPLVGFLGDRYGLSVGLLALTPIALAPAIMTLLGVFERTAEREPG